MHPRYFTYNRRYRVKATKIKDGYELLLQKRWLCFWIAKQEVFIKFVDSIEDAGNKKGTEYYVKDSFILSNRAYRMAAEWVMMDWLSRNKVPDLTKGGIVKSNVNMHGVNGEETYY